MHIFENYSHEYKARKIFELWIKSCYPGLCQTKRNMSKSKGWTLQSSLLTLWMEKTQVNNQTKIAGQEKLTITL